MGVSNAWAWTSRQTGTISSVYVTGSMNSWNTNDQNWKLSSIDGNHWKGTFYLKGQSSNYTFKLYINATNRNDYYSTGYNYHKDWTGGEAPIYTDKGNASITPRTTTTTKYIKVEIDFYASYGNDDHGYLSVTQTDVSDLSPSLNATSTALIAGGTSTLTASCSGGSGGYTYSYKVTCDGSDVTNSTLNTTSGSSVKFTAPTVTGKKTYTITVTAKDSHALLSGLATKTATKTITVEEAHNVTISYKCGSTTVKNNTTTNNVKFETKSTITAPDIPGYKFANWTLGTGIASSDETTANPIKITTKSSGNYTLTANYTENTFVVRGGAKFGDTWSKDTHVMTKKNASEKIVYYTITLDGTNNINNVSNSQFQFKIYEKERDEWYGLTAGGDQYWYTRGMGQLNLDGNGKNIEIRADVKGDYEIKVDYSDPNSSPKITVTYPQKSYYLSGSWDDWKGEYPIENTSVTIHLEKGEHSFLIFDYQAGAKYYGNTEKMERTNCSGWQMTDNAGNCRIYADITGEYKFTFDASTKKLTVLYPMLVTLGSSKFGPYGIKYNGQSYFSKETEDVVIGIPKGATINFIEGQPYSNLYTGDIMEKDKVRKFDLTQPYTVEESVKFEPNYVTKVAQIAYLGVPNNCDWDKDASYDNFTWRFDSYKSFSMTNSNDRATYAFEANGVKYYKFTIPAGCNKFQIQRKQANNDDSNNTSHTYSHTCDHEFMVLNTGINCYMLNEGTFEENTHTGYWCELPAAVGDYRLLYVEQVVEKDANGNTVVTRKKAHPSDVVRAGEITASGKIVSLHIYKDRKYQANLGGGGTYESSSNPEIILQQYKKITEVENGDKKEKYEWEDVEWHMVFGPLETLPSMGMLPGRRNTVREDLTYDNGIDKIKNDTHKYQGNGVWNFYIINNGTKVTLDLNKTVRYEGKYYIRTDAAVGGWNTYTATSNHMGHSEISMTHSNYSHYFCKWISNAGTNVKYTIANDYGMAISDTLTHDTTDIWGTPLVESERMVIGETLPASANVRFSWNEKTNFQHRAYLAGSGEIGNRFLVVEGEDSKILNADGQTLDAAVYDEKNPRSNLDKNEEIFNDISNWVYYADVQLVPNAGLKVTAKYYDKVQYFVGQEDNFNNTILAGSGEQKYLIRLLYDFKTNHLLSAYIPGGQAGKEIEPIQADLMLVRKENEIPAQLSFSSNNMKDVSQQAYGVLELTKSTLEDNSKNVYVRSLYWISFPFDVRITDVFGFGEYGKHWLIQSYDGAKRAANGLWADSETNWVYHFDPNTLNAEDLEHPEYKGVMKRGVGYVVALNLNKIKADNLFVGRITTLALYFPAVEKIAGHIINADAVSIPVPAHQCTINRPTPDGDRTIKDSHWNVIGVPSYINAVGDFSGRTIEKTTRNLSFYYRWLGDYDKYEPLSKESGVDFRSLNAYMVQFAGDLKWSNVLNEGPASLAAKRNSDDIEEYNLRIELHQNGQEQDRTFIQLLEEDVTHNFDFNFDLCKINNKGANIYSLIATDTYPVEVAGNALPVEETIIPLGIKLDAAGEYTFAMPQGTDKIVVELIDYENNTRTNMLLDDYTVNLGKGTFETRFALHVKPDKTVTGLEEVNTNTNGVKKYLINGILYMQKDGSLYDAQGKLVR